MPLPLGEVPPQGGGEGKKPSQSRLTPCQLSQRESQGMIDEVGGAFFTARLGSRAPTRFSTIHQVCHSDQGEAAWRNLLAVRWCSRSLDSLAVARDDRICGASGKPRPTGFCKSAKYIVGEGLDPPLIRSSHDDREGQDPPLQNKNFSLI